MKSATLNTRDLRAYVSMRLADGVERIENGLSLHEGLYDAYRGSLQWLDDINDLPASLGFVLSWLQGGERGLPVGSRTRRVRERLAVMSVREATALFRLIERERGASTNHLSLKGVIQ